MISNVAGRSMSAESDRTVLVLGGANIDPFEDSAHLWEHFAGESKMVFSIPIVTSLENRSVIIDVRNSFFYFTNDA